MTELDSNAFVEFVSSQWHDSMRGPLEQLFKQQPRESKLTITKAQRSLRDEDNRRVWRMRMDEIRILLAHLKMLSPTIHVQEQLQEAEKHLSNAEEQHNAQVRD